MKTCIKISFLLVTLTLVLARCGGVPLPKNPVVELQKNVPKTQVYTVALSDMDLEGDQYKHKYKIFEKTGNIVSVRTTGLIDVSDDFFRLHENDLGMELRSQDANGKVNNLVAPPGFSNFVGKSEYGSWVETYKDTMNVTSYTDSTFWVFKDAFKSLEKELGVKGLKITLGEYERFQASFAYNRPYYGDKTAPDSTKYGTRSRHWMYVYPMFYSRRRYKRNFYKSTPTVSRSRGGGGFGK